MAKEPSRIDVNVGGTALPVIIGALVAVIAGLVLFGPCNKPTPAPSVQPTLDSVNELYEYVQRVNDSLQRETDMKADSLESLTDELQRLKETVKRQAAAGNSLAVRVIERTVTDSSTCDSLAHAYIDLYAAFKETELVYDSIIGMKDRQLSVALTQADVNRAALTAMRAHFDTLAGSYSTLEGLYNRETRRGKWGRTKSRILAAALLGALGKIAFDSLKK